MEGLVPVAEQAKVYLTERYKGRQFFIGLDSALLIGHPAAMATALVMMPISLVLAVILPGNKFLPFSDLVLFPFVFAMIVPMCKGNILRSVIVSTIVLAFGLYFSTGVAQAFTNAAYMGGMKALEAGQLASSVVDGSTPTGWLFMTLFSLLPH
jgi:PTS system galactitol-specific IIC component